MIQEVSTRYARAMFETAQAQKKSDQYLAELREVAEGVRKDAAVAEFLASPIISKEDKTKALDKVLGKLSPDVGNFLRVLIDNERIANLGEVVDSLEQLIDDSHGVTRGTVRSASPLDPEQRKDIEATVKKVTGKQVILKFEVDKTLVGGLVAKVGGWTFDDSLTAHLGHLKENLSRDLM